jgi:DNA methylase
VIVDTTSPLARLHLERYEDLLAVRALPDYRFVGAADVECDAADLAALGLAAPVETSTVDPAPHLFDYQAWLVRRAVERERFAIFADTGLGKTAMQLDWARLVTALRDATSSFPQTGEYLMVFTAPGDNVQPVRHQRADWTFEHHTAVMNTIWPETDQWRDDDEARMWDEWVDPDGSGAVWTGIRETDVLTASTAKDHPEEKHVCPLQLGLIERCVSLWTNPGELVLSPFAGIGSEGWESLRLGRRFYGVELKDSYYRTAARNLADIEKRTNTEMRLFDEAS